MGLDECDLLANVQMLPFVCLGFRGNSLSLNANGSQKIEVEGLQKTAVQIIYGRSMPYGQRMEELEGQLMYLEDRRHQMIDKFLLKMAKDEYYADRWFLRRSFTGHYLRKELFYNEENSKTKRLYLSPLFYFHRRLNEIHTPDK